MSMSGSLVIAVDNFDGALLEQKDRSFSVVCPLGGAALEGFEQMCLDHLGRFFLF
jgi:hypothetical protein